MTEADVHPAYPSLDLAPRGRGFFLSCLMVWAGSIAATAYFCISMAGGMDMPGGWTMSMAWMRMPGQSWLQAALMYLAMWEMMMVAMMGPSVVPILRQYQLKASSGLAAQLAAGYYFVYLLIGVVTYPLGIGLAQAAMSWAPVSLIVPYLTAGTLILAGIIQQTPWKRAHLTQCRDPLHCCASTKDVRHTADGPACRVAGIPQGTWWMGLRWGMSCALCCSGIMLALFVLGMMNPWVIIVLTVLITLERLMPRPEGVARLSGLVAIALGIMMLCRSIGGLSL